MTLFQYVEFFSDPLTSRQTRAPMRTRLMPIASVVLTIPKTAIGSETARSERGKAFVHAVMEGMTAQSEGGRGLAECGVAIVFLIIVTL